MCLCAILKALIFSSGFMSASKFPKSSLVFFSIAVQSTNLLDFVI